jgi:hypothetical protein
MEERIRRRLLVSALAHLEHKHCNGNNVMATAQAIIAQRLVTVTGMTRGNGHTCIGKITGESLRSCYQKEENSGDTK